MKKWAMAIAATVMAGAIAVPGMAEVQNIKVDGEITVRGFIRDNYRTTGSGGGIGFQGSGSSAIFTKQNSQDWYNTTALLGVNADLTDNVMATIRLGNERDWGVNTTGLEDDVKVYDAFLTFQEFMTPELDLKAGRMPVRISDALLIGDGITNETLLGSDYSARKEFDGILGVLDYDALVLTLGTLKIAEAQQSAADDTDVYLIDFLYKFDMEGNTNWDTTLADVHYSSPGSGGTGPTGASDKGIDVFALESVLNAALSEGVTGKVGFGYQFGEYQEMMSGANRDLQAWAFDAGIDFAADVVLSPKVGLKYMYRSGEKSGNTSGDYKAWLPLFEDQYNGVIYDPNTNISAVALTGSLMPLDKLTLAAELWLYTLAKKQALDMTNGTTEKRDAGQELDLSAVYSYTEDVTIGMGLSWFFPGDFYGRDVNDIKHDQTAMQAMAELGVRF